MNFEEEPNKEEGIDFDRTNLEAQTEVQAPKPKRWSYKSENLVEDANGLNSLF